MIAIKTMLFAFCISVVGMVFTSGGVRAEDYVLGPGDHLRLKILEWRPGAGEPYDWPGLSGEFIVGAGGEISLPMLGRIEAAGHTAATLSDMIGVRLQSEVGLVRKVQTSLEVTEHRPFYIAGGVDKPGEYPYRPGITVIEAISLAGGLYRNPDAENNLRREAIQAQGEQRTLGSDRIGLLAGQARLRAEIDASGDVQFPPELTGSKNDARVAAAMNEQLMLFKSRKDSLKAQVDGLEQIKMLYKAEIDTLKGKIQSIAQQSNLNKTGLEGVATLMSKGLTTAPRKLALEQNAAQFESSRLELELSVVRAQQAISKADRDETEAINARRNEALVELGQNRAKLGENDENLATARRLARQAEAMLARRPADVDQASLQTYEIIRQGEPHPIRASETDAIKPGDVLRVSESRFSAMAD